MSTIIDAMGGLDAIDLALMRAPFGPGKTAICAEIAADYAARSDRNAVYIIHGARNVNRAYLDGKPVDLIYHDEVTLTCADYVADSHAGMSWTELDDKIKEMHARSISLRVDGYFDKLMADLMAPLKPHDDGKPKGTLKQIEDRRAMCRAEAEGRLRPARARKLTHTKCTEGF